MDQEKQLKVLQEIRNEEDEAFREWKKLKQEPIPLVIALKMYELYLNGYTCDEIWRINGKQHHLGKIVDAKVRYEWDKRREMQIASLFSNIEEKVLKVKNEAVSYLSDLLAAAHKMWGDKVKQFIQEGNPELLNGFDPSSIKNYKEILGMLQELTEKAEKAQASSKTVKVDGTVSHVHSVTEPKKMGSGLAHDLLKQIEKAGKLNDN